MSTPIAQLEAEWEKVARDNATLPPPPDSPVGRAITRAGGQAKWKRLSTAARQATINEVRGEASAAARAAYEAQVAAVAREAEQRTARANAAHAMAEREKVEAIARNAEFQAEIDNQWREEGARLASMPECFSAFSPAQKELFYKCGGKRTN